MEASKRFYTLLGLLLLIIILSAVMAFGQGRDNVWVFGHNVGLDFSSGSPVEFDIPGNGFYALEGCASISDKNGHLLFYTNGSTIYNKNYLPMPNGGNIIPSGQPISVESTTQATVIVPVPCEKSKYYVFSLGDEYCDGQLIYSVVDMSLDGGLGDVVQNQKGILLDAGPNTEKMTVAKGQNQNIWLIIRSRWTNEYKAYSISNAGINTTPVISNIGNAPPVVYQYGAIKSSPDNTKIAAVLAGGAVIAQPFTWDSTYVETYDFDNLTGTLSNAHIIDRKKLSLFGGDGEGYYGLCFSPDGLKLYVSKTISYGTQSSFHGQVVQFNLSLPNIANIIASRTSINIYPNQPATFPFPSAQFLAYPGGGPGDMKIGPDGKLYIAIGGYYMDRINFPNLAGAACDFESQAVTLSTALPIPGIGNFGCLYGLPADIVSVEKDTTSSGGLVKNIIACQETTLHCSNEADNYLWNTGETTPDITVTDSGTYWVKTQEGCNIINTDSFMVSFVEPPQPQLGADTIICEGESITLSSKTPISNPFTFTWNTGNHSASIRVSNPGTYWLKASLPPCFKIDSITIDVKNCGCLLQIPTAFSPNGDGINDMFKPANNVYCQDIKNYALQIYNRYGQLIFKSTHLQKGWQGRFKGAPVETGTYFYALRYEGRKGQMIHKKGDVTLVR